jgi:hypothetical protein
MTNTLLTLNKIKAANPHKTSWVNLLSFLGKTKADDEPLTFKQVIDACGVTDALWCLRFVDNPQLIGKFTLKLAARAANYHNLPETKQCQKVHRAYLKGEATREELVAAYAEATAARATARVVVRAAYAARIANASTAADAANVAADASADAVENAEAYADVAAEIERHAKLIIKMFDGGQRN